MDPIYLKLKFIKGVWERAVAKPRRQVEGELWVIIPLPYLNK